MVKECTEQLQELFAVTSSITKQYQLRDDLVKPFEVVCDKFMVSYDEEHPLSHNFRYRSKSYQKYSKVLTTSNSYRQSRLSG